MTALQEIPCRVQDLTVAYHDLVVLQNLSFAVPPGAVMGILGPNGAGKTTLLKAMLELVGKTRGEVEFFGASLAKTRTRVGYMPQVAEVDWDFPTTVADVVTMGTYGHLGWGRRPGPAQRAVAQWAMDQVGIGDLARRQISQLSGGQKQRAFMARTLAQDPDLLLLDEPFAGVDMASERAIRQVLARLTKEGKTIMVVHHDLASVSSFCSHVLLLAGGQLVSSGRLDQAFTTEHLHRAYGIADLETFSEQRLDV